MPGTPPLTSAEITTITNDLFEQAFDGLDPGPPPPPARPHRPRGPAPADRDTDLGNALRFQAEYGDQFRYCPASARWLRWTGTHWDWDDLLVVRRVTHDLFYALATQALADHDTDLTKHALKSQSARSLSACLTLAQALLPLSLDALDTHPFRLATVSGTLDLATGSLVPATPSDFLTQCCPTPFVPDAPAPLWEAFLGQIVPDPEVRWFLQKAVGYSLTGDTREQCLFMLHGSGANGKSTFLDTLLAVLGPFVRHVPSDLFRGTSGTPHPSNRAFLRGLRLAIVSETEHGQSLTESLVKQLTGDTEIDAREMYGSWFTFRPTVKLWWGCNHLPHIKGTDHGFWRRVHRVPFTVTIPEEDQDKTLGTRLLSEAPGILAWAVRGCLAWQAEGLLPPASIRAATAAYRTSEDFVAQFLDECCETVPGDRTRAADLYARSVAYATEEGFRRTPLTKKAFTQRLIERGYEIQRSHGSTYVLGLRVIIPYANVTDFD